MFKAIQECLGFSWLFPQCADVYKSQAGKSMEKFL